MKFQLNKDESGRIKLSYVPKSSQRKAHWPGNQLCGGFSGADEQKKFPYNFNNQVESEWLKPCLECRLIWWKLCRLAFPLSPLWLYKPEPTYLERVTAITKWLLSDGVNSWEKAWIWIYDSSQGKSSYAHVVDSFLYNRKHTIKGKQKFAMYFQWKFILISHMCYTKVQKFSFQVFKKVSLIKYFRLYVFPEATAMCFMRRKIREISQRAPGLSWGRSTAGQLISITRQRSGQRQAESRIERGHVTIFYIYSYEFKDIGLHCIFIYLVRIIFC